MNLDKQISAITENVRVTHSLDGADDVLGKYGDIYSDILEEAQRIGIMSPVQSAVIKAPVEDIILDVNEVLQFDKADFVENAYERILGRPVDKAALNANLANLESGKVSKIDVLKGIADSEEAKARRVILTGFKELALSEFLQYHERAFVERAYILILGRRGDAAGVENYLKQLMIGEVSREEVLYAMKHSEEGSKRELTIIGLDEIYKKRMAKKRIQNIPVIGKVARVCKNLLGTERRLRSLTIKEYQAENKIEQLQQRHDEFVNQENVITHQMSELISQLAEVQIQVLESAELSEKFNKKITESGISIGEMKKQIEESGISVGEVKKQLEESHLRISEIKEQEAKTAERIDRVEKTLVELQGFTGQIGSNVNSINETLEGVCQKIHGIMDSLQENEKSAKNQALEDKKATQALMEEIAVLKGRVFVLENEERKAVSQVSGQSLPVEESGDVYASIDYFDFENHFRGSREHVKNVQTMYLPYFEGKKNVLDLGCGRGEFTEMLLEKNVGVTGVDQYVPYVEYMKMLGLPVVLDDAVRYLKKQENVDGIFVGQVVEHISVEQIMELCRLAYEKLEDGCYLIMETPNPTSLAIYTECFYMDPSHEKPVHPQTLKYFAEKAGFSSVEILYTQSSRLPFSIPKLKEDEEEYKEFNQAMERVSNLLFGSQDYAIIARK